MDEATKICPACPDPKPLPLSAFYKSAVMCKTCLQTPRFPHVCITCGKERLTTVRHNKSGMCHTCACTAGRNKRLAMLKTADEVVPGAVYPVKTLERFWSYVDKDTACDCHTFEDRCWQWTGRIFPETFYGNFSIKSIPTRAHRFAYQAEHGILPADIYVLHRPPCVLKHCVRHLYAGTAQDNTNDIKQMGHFPTGTEHAEKHNHYENWRRGADNHKASFEISEILAIRQAYRDGVNVNTLARDYRRAYSTIKCIVSYKTWRHVP